LQWGFTLSMPQSRPMSVIGPKCHELRVQDTAISWRIMYRVSETEIVGMEVFAKKTTTTPQSVIENGKKRLALYDSIED
jgi:phage-related protein